MSVYMFLASRFDHISVPVSSKRTLTPLKSPTNEIKRTRKLKLNIRSPLLNTFKKNVQQHRRQRATQRKRETPRCTSKTLSKLAGKDFFVYAITFRLSLTDRVSQLL